MTRLPNFYVRFYNALFPILCRCQTKETPRLFAFRISFRHVSHLLFFFLRCTSPAYDFPVSLSKQTRTYTPFFGTSVLTLPPLFTHLSKPLGIPENRVYHKNGPFCFSVRQTNKIYAKASAKNNLFLAGLRFFLVSRMKGCQIEMKGR